MSKRKFSIVTAFLLLLLVAAILNNIFVYHAYNDAIRAQTPPDAPAAIPAAGVSTAGVPHHHRAVSAAVGGQPLGPGWYGEAYLQKTEGGYDIVVDAFGSGSRTRIALDAIEVDVRQPGATQAHMTPSVVRTDDGKFVAHAEFPSAGTWEVRVRMHRGNQELEFAEKFDLKN